jgi:hypothetical protein
LPIRKAAQNSGLAAEPIGQWGTPQGTKATRWMKSDKMDGWLRLWRVARRCHDGQSPSANVGNPSAKRRGVKTDEWQMAGSPVVARRRAELAATMQATHVQGRPINMPPVACTPAAASEKRQACVGCAEFSKARRSARWREARWRCGAQSPAAMRVTRPQVITAISCIKAGGY